jgi:hypothetical protein
VSISPDDLRASFLQYITGLLPEPGKTHFEEQLLADQNFSDAAAACEQELIDAYAMHRLDAEEARVIGLWVEASPDRVERVAMARALLQATPHRGLHRRQISFALAAAACLLVAAALYLVNTKMMHHQQSNTQLSAANTSPQNQTPPQIQPQTPKSAATTATAKPDVVLIAAERTRGEQKTATYQVHRENPVQLQIVLPGETAHSGYQLRVTPLADPGKTLLQQNDLEAQSMAGQLYLTVTLPPGSLPPETYLASVSHQGDTFTSTFTLKWAHQ